jgi:hypothetical protein
MRTFISASVRAKFLYESIGVFAGEIERRRAARGGSSEKVCRARSEKIAALLKGACVSRWDAKFHFEASD